jgi:hypothetical protein
MIRNACVRFCGYVNIQVSYNISWLEVSNKSLGLGPAVGGRRWLHGMGQKLFTMSKMYQHNILEPVLGRPSKKESKITLMPKIW